MGHVYEYPRIIFATVRQRNTHIRAWGFLWGKKAPLQSEKDADAFAHRAFREKRKIQRHKQMTSNERPGTFVYYITSS